MLIGAVAAIGGGVASPLFMLIFGDIINAFTFNALTKKVSLHWFNKTVSCNTALIMQNFSNTENCVDNEGLIRSINLAIYKIIGIAVGLFVGLLHTSLLLPDDL